MGSKLNTIGNKRSKLQRTSGKRFTPVRVIDIILSPDHYLFETYGGHDSIGTILYTRIEDSLETPNPESGNVAKPLYPYLNYYPLKNEIVLILTVKDKGIYDNSYESTYYLPPVNVWNHPHHNALPDPKELNQEETSRDYAETEAGVIRKVKDGGTDINLGEYFKEQDKLKPLLPYEGDFLIEGRFGNSIRLGSTNIKGKNPWSNSDNEEDIGSPITVIRNGQPTDENDESWVHTTEDIDKDPSSIYLTSKQSLPFFKSAGVPTLDPYSISWPSYGEKDPTEAVEPLVQKENIEELTPEEAEEIIQGEEEIEEIAPVYAPQITIIEELPTNEEDDVNSKASKYANELFGKHVTLELLAGADQIYQVAKTEIQQTSDGDQRHVYYPLKTNEGTSKITAKKLTEIMSYYKVNVSNKPQFIFGFAKEALEIGIAKGYFRPHYMPVTNTMHLPSYDGYMNLFKDAVAEAKVEEEELDLAIRTMVLDDTWAELAHAADIDLNGIGGYTKDDFNGSKVGEWFQNLFNGKTKQKDKVDSEPDDILVTTNFTSDNLEIKDYFVSINYINKEATQIGSEVKLKYNVELDFGEIPGVGSIGIEKNQVIFPGPAGITRMSEYNTPGSSYTPEFFDFDPDTGLSNNAKKRVELWANNFLRRYFADQEVVTPLRYHDRNLVGDWRYDNLQHYEGRTHQIVEPQLAAVWLEDYDADQELDTNTFVEAIGVDETSAQEIYDEYALESNISTPPIKYFNKATGEYLYRSEEKTFPEEDTVMGQGSSTNAKKADQNARSNAENKARDLNGVLGSFIKGSFIREGDEYVFTNTYAITYNES